MVRRYHFPGEATIGALGKNQVRGGSRPRIDGVQSKSGMALAEKRLTAAKEKL
jgi:hypothetical protein